MGDKKKWVGLAAAGAAIAAFATRISRRSNRNAKPEEQTPPLRSVPDRSVAVRSVPDSETPIDTGSLTPTATTPSIEPAADGTQTTTQTTT